MASIGIDLLCNFVEMKKVKIPFQNARAMVDVGSVDLDNNTIEVVFATETPVKRYDWGSERYFYEVLTIADDAIDLARMQNGAPVLAGHNTWDLGSVIGVVQDVRIDTKAKEARATVKLSEEDADKGVIAKIQKGIIRNVSVGYTIDAYEVSDVDADIPTLTATRWQPREISFVPVPSDYNSGVRSEDKNNFQTVKIVNPEVMEKNTTTQAAERAAEQQTETVLQPATVNEAAVREAAVADERKRVAEITDACTRAALPAEFSQTLIDNGSDINAARAAIIDEVAKRANPAPSGRGAKVTGEDESVQSRNAIIDGIMARAVPGSVDLKGNEKAQQYRNMRLLDVAKERLRAAGENHSMLSEHEIVKRAWATTDYPNLLTATFDRTLRRFYEGSVDDWKFIARPESATDFREKTGIKVDGAVSFEEIPEGGEYRETPILQDDKASIRLKKYGRKYSITDIAIINDDLSVFSRLPKILAIGAQQFQSDAVWDLLISNKKAPDGKAMFHTDHKNLASSGAVISEATLSAGRTAMRRQVSPAGNKLGIRPKYLLVPPELETAAQKMVTSILATQYGDVNVFANTLQVVVSDQLTDKKAWYLVADPEMITADGLVYAYLNGQPGLHTESRVNWNTDALEVKGSMAFSAAVWGWEGWYKNPGA